MINKIKITDLSTAKKLVRGYEEGFTAWITTVDFEDEKHCFDIKRLLRRRDVLHLHRFFGDYEDHEQNCEVYGPSIEDVKIIVEFLKSLHNSDNSHYIGINCYAGHCRSTAIGMIAFMISGFSAEIALDKVLKIRPSACPNTRILRFFDELTGNCSKKVVDIWRGKVSKGGIILL